MSVSRTLLTWSEGWEGWREMHEEKGEEARRASHVRTVARAHGPRDARGEKRRRACARRHTWGDETPDAERQEHVPDARGASRTAPARLRATPPPRSESPASSPGGPARMGRGSGSGKLCLQDPWEVTGAMLGTCFLSGTRSFPS